MKLRKIVLPILAVMALILTFVLPAAAEYDPNTLSKANVTVDDQRLEVDAYIVDGRTMVPMRAIFERLGATLEWNAETKTVTATKGGKVIVLTVSKLEAKVDGQPLTLSVPPILINGKTFVPLRFVSQALGAEVAWDQPSSTAVIKTGSTGKPGQKHQGTINSQGETWTAANSPHYVAGEFRIEGKDSPVLVIEEGATVFFESGASLKVGQNNPGGLTINGKANNPVTLTAATDGAQAGFWSGISFYNQTIKGQANITGAVIKYAGGSSEYSGAIYIEGNEKQVEVLVKDTTIENSQYSGLNMYGMGRLAVGSGNLKIIGTRMADGKGGFPIITGAYGSHNLPRGEYKDNEITAVNICNNSYSDTISSNTTWRNVGIPYAISQTINVEGNATPTLNIEPGVITLWAHNTSLVVGWQAPGNLVADAIARPEGGGEWFTRPEGGGEWRVEKAELDLGVQVATASSIEPGCALCGKNRAIVFGAWDAAPEKGAWDGIQLKGKAGDKSRLNGVVIAYGGVDKDYSAGLYCEAEDGKSIKFTISNSMISDAARSGMEFYGNVQMKPESTGNYFVRNGWPIRLQPDYIGYLTQGNTYSENENHFISVWTNNYSNTVTKTATWKNLGLPYKFECTVYIGGSSSPVITIEPGTELKFATGTGITVGSDGMGTLVAKGAAGKPIKFTGIAARPGGWEGLRYSDQAGNGNILEYVTIEYANYGVDVAVDLGGFIKNSTIRSSKEMGIYRGYGVEGTSFMNGLGNQFEGNTVDENKE